MSQRTRSWSPLLSFSVTSDLLLDRPSVDFRLCGPFSEQGQYERREYERNLMKMYGKFSCGVVMCLILLGLNGQAAKVSSSPQQYLFGQATFPGPASPSYVASGDFHGDGKLDFVLADPQHAVVSVLIGRPDRTFAPPVNFSTGNTPRFVAVADFNRDGKSDLAVAFGTFTSCCSGVSILLGNGNGSFAPAVGYPLSGVPFGITVGDFR